MFDSVLRILELGSSCVAFNLQSRLNVKRNQLSPKTFYIMSICVVGYSLEHKVDILPEKIFFVTFHLYCCIANSSNVSSVYIYLHSSLFRLDAGTFGTMGVGVGFAIATAFHAADTAKLNGTAPSKVVSPLVRP